MRGGSREARQKARAAPPSAPAFLTRAIPPYDLLSEEALQAVERHADLLLEEIGFEIRGDAEAIALWRAAGARIEGEWRVHVPAGADARHHRPQRPAGIHAASPAIPSAMYRSADGTACLHPPTARHSSPIWSVDAATAPSRISRTS